MRWWNTPKRLDPVGWRRAALEVADLLGEGPKVRAEMGVDDVMSGRSTITGRPAGLRYDDLVALLEPLGFAAAK